ncbi:MAG: peptidylprolyl isomerase [Bacteroidetes bacterium]|nr:peptidylprolyl isomerase [Bacteroidota bacterium]
MMLFKRSNRVTIIGLFLIAAALFAPSAQAQQKNSVVAEIGPYKLTLGEYERQYIRNNGGETAAYRSSMENRMDFLDLLVKYRLKVLQAHEKGYDKDPEILRELSEYRNSLAIPYLTERALIDPNIESLYKRRLEEVRAAHILIRIPVDSLGVEDSLSARNKAMDIIRQAQAGVPFDSLARQYSDDKGTAQNGGDLMWFTAGMTVPAFDQAVYELKLGELRPLPIRTMFGYHVVKLLDRKPARGEIQVSHILVRLPVEEPSDSMAAFQKITSIRDSISNGVDFAELAARNSEDPSSGANGGDLGWVGRRKFVPDFEVVAFELQPNEISRVVRTQFGYHIIKVTGERPPKSFEDSRQELKDLYRRYSYEQDNRAFIDGIVAKYNVKVNDDVSAMIIKNVDTTATTSAPGWYNRITDPMKEKTWITLKGASITIGEAIKTIERNQDLQSKALNRASVAQLADMIGQKEALRLETTDLETRYPEFGTLMQEYREGVLLFRAEQDAVWNSVKVDEDRLKEFWEEHKADYTWPDRVRFSEIFVTSDSLGQVLRDSLNAGVDFGELAERHTQRTGYKKKLGDWGFQTLDANELAVAAAKAVPGWIEGPMKFQYGYSLIKVTEKDKAREKTFEEAQSEVSSKFQEFESKRLEREWIQSLKDKFGVKIHDDVLKKAFSDLKVEKS